MVGFDWLAFSGTSAEQPARRAARRRATRHDRRRPRCTSSALLLDARAVYGFGRLSGKLGL
jgi:hypothetical protein